MMQLFPGQFVANLSYLLDDNNTAHLIANGKDRDKFYITDGGVLYTNSPLDREVSDSYMLTVIIGKRGLPRAFRSQSALQIKVIH